MVLSIVLLFLIGGAAAWRLGKRIKPRDPAGLARQAAQAAEKNDLAAAAKLIDEALGGADGDVKYFVQAIRIYLDWSHAPTLNDTEKAFRIKKADAMLEIAIQKTPDDPELRSIQADMRWDLAIAADNWDGWTRFDETARQALRTREDPEIRYRLAIANLRRSSLRPEKLEPALADFSRAATEGKQVRYWLGGPDRDNRNLILQGYLPTVLMRKPSAAAGAFALAIQAMPDSADIRVAYGNYLVRTNQPKQALGQYEKALQCEPGGIVPELALARFHTVQGEHGKALEYANRARNEHGDDYRTYLELSNVLNILNRQADAIPVLRDGLAAVENWAPTQPVRGAWLTKRTGIIELNYALSGTLLDKAGAEPEGPAMQADLKEVDKYLDRLGQIEPNSFQFHQISGRLALARTQIGKAVAELDAAFKIRNFDTRTAGLLFDLYMSQGLPGKAEGLIGRMEKSPELLGSPFAALCKALLAIKYMDYDAANAQLVRITGDAAVGAKAQELLFAIYRAAGRLVSLPDDFKPSRQSAALLSERADFLWRHDQPGKAAEILEELSAKSPSDLSVTSQLMRMYLDLGQIDKARAVLERALASHPGDSRLMAQWELLSQPDPGRRFEMQMAIAGQNPDPILGELQKAAVCENFGLADRALEHLQAARKINPDNPNVIGGLFNRAIAAKDWKLAGTMADQAASLNIDGLGGLLFRGRLAMEQDQAAQAVQIFRQIVRDRPDNKVMRVMLGQAHLRKYAAGNSTSDLTASQEAFKAVLAIDPAYAPALIGMAQTAQKMGRRAEQEDWIRKAWRVAPDEPYVRDMYMELPEVAANPLEIVARRQMMMEKNPGDLENVAALARLMEDPRMGRPDEAERLYRIVWQNSPDKLAAANLLIGFFVRSGRSSQAEEILSRLDAEQKDRVGVLVLRGSFLSNYNPVQARQAFEEAARVAPKDPRGCQALALLSIAERNWPQAVKAMEKLLELEPGNKAVQKDLTACQIEAGLFDSASARIQEMLTADPGNTVAMTHKGMLLVRKGDLDGALETLTTAKRMSPRHAQPPAYRAQVYALKGDLPKAAEDLKAALELSGDNTIAMDLAVLYQRMWNLDKAQEVCRQVLTEHPDLVPAIRLLAGLYLLVGKWQELATLLGQAAAIYPGDPVYPIIRARTFQVRDDPAGRLAAMQEAIAKFPNDPTARIEYIQTLADAGKYRQIVEYLRDNPADSAIASEAGALEAMAELKLDQSAAGRIQDVFAGLLRRAPPAQLGFVMARIQQAYGPAGAADRSDAWLSARPGDWRIMSLLGSLLSAAERPDQAAAMLEKALQATDAPAARLEIQIVMAECFQRAGDYRKTVEAYKAALEIDPDDVRILNNLAFVLADRMDDASRALELVQKAYRLAPGLADVMDTYAWTLAQLGHDKDAAGWLDPICQVFRPKAIYLYHLGRVRQKLGETGKAKECYRRAAELAGDKELSGMIERELGKLKGRGD